LTIIRKIFQIIIVTAAVGLPLSSFTDLDWEIVAAITGLVFLLMVQLQFILSRTRINRGRPTSQKPGPKKPTKAATALPAAKTGLKGKAIDPSLFSKFQENLTQSTGPEAEKTDGKDEVILSLSNKGKSKNLKKPPITTQAATTKVKKSPPAKPATDQKTDETLAKDISVAPIGPLFDDIREPPEMSSGKVDPVKLPAKKLKTLGLPPDKVAEIIKDTPSTNEIPLASNEVLTSTDFEADKETAEDEATITLSLAKSYFKKKEFGKSLSALKQFLDEPDQGRPTSDLLVEMVQMQGECEFELEAYEKASKHFQDLFKNHINNEHSQYLDRLEQVIEKFVDADQQQHAVHFLFTALNEFRQLHEFHKMDDIYTEIESAYHQKLDLPRLTQTYQNHLAIKKTIKDFKGQLDILDHLGKLLYDQGDDEGSRKCYEQRLSIESQMEKS
jgi:tetratricopeptide (TPR) repeat protein